MKTGVLVIFYLIFTISAFAQVQVGELILGEGDSTTSSDNFGYSVSLNSDGSRLVVGGISNNDGGTNSGHVRVFEWENNEWAQIGSDIDGMTPNEGFGYSVDISNDGNIVAIGAPFGMEGHGGIRIYEWNDSSWNQLGSDIVGEAYGDFCGRSVSLSGNGKIVAVGASSNNGNAPRAGHARIFRWGGNDWLQMGSDIDGVSQLDYAGSSICLSETGVRVAVGSPGNNDKGQNSGHVRIFEWEENGWSQLGSNIEGEGEFYNFGTAVSLSGDGKRVIAGSTKLYVNGEANAHARVFEWNESGWIQIGQKIEGTDKGYDHDRFVGISDNGKRVVVGFPDEDPVGSNSGYVVVFDWNGNNWVQSGDQIESVEKDEFGRSVSISGDGNRIAIGAPGRYPEGIVQIFSLSGLTNSTRLNPITSVRAYPNPANNQIILPVNHFKYEILNVAGKVVQNGRVEGQRISIESLPTGIYLLQVNDGQKVYQTKFVKE